MKIEEVESTVRDLLSRDMHNELVSKGYKYLAHGVEHSVWIGPDNFVYKIMPPRYVHSEVAKNLQLGQTDLDNIYLTKSQRAFIDWVEYCQQHPNNRFIPHFDDWQTHVRNINGRTYVYIQARTERLFDLSAAKLDSWGTVLSKYAAFIRNGYPIKNIMKNLKYNHERNPVEYEVVSHMGKAGFTEFWNTITDLVRIGKAKGYSIDLHRANFMLGSDGHIVINDPYYVKYSDDSKIDTSKLLNYTSSLDTDPGLKFNKFNDELLKEAAAKITSSMFSDIANMYASGDSVPTIAKKYDVDRKTISYHLKRLPNYDEIYVKHWKNAQYSPTYPANFTSQQIKQMADLYSSGAKLVDIARKFGVTPDNASLIIRRHHPDIYNVAREPGAPGYSRGVTADMIQRMKYLRDSGMSYRDIGKKFSLDHKTVMHHLKRIGNSST